MQIGNDLFAAQIGLTMIEMTFIAPGKSTLLAALRTQGRRRHEILFPGNYRRHFFIELQIFIRDEKGLPTVRTGFLHGGLMHGGEITHFTVNFFWAIRRVARMNYFLTLSALSLPLLSRGAQRETLTMSLLRTFARDRKIHFFIKLQFLRNHFIRTVGGFT